MNILIKSDNFSKNSVNYLETKPNMMFDGLFTKVNYCDDFMVMYGVYLDIPIQQVENSAKPVISSASFAVFQSIELDMLRGYLEYRGIKENTILYNLTIISLYVSFIILPNLIQDNQSIRNSLSILLLK